MALGICLLAAGKTTAFAATAFTLAWTHSVEKTRWEEDWNVTPAGQLQLAAARIKGSGAGMEPPEGAVLDNGWWVYRPSLPPQPSLTLALSGSTGSGWQFCPGKTCMEIGATAGPPVELRACEFGP